MAIEGTLEERKKKASGKGVNIYLVKGFCPEFFMHLERFTLFLYKKYHVYIDFDEFYSACHAKIIERLITNMYDETKSPFTTYLFSLIKNEARKVNSKHKKLMDTEPDFSRMASCEDSTISPCICQFVEYAANLGLVFDPVELEHDIMNECDSPYVVVFTWMRAKNQLR